MVAFTSCIRLLFAIQITMLILQETSISAKPVLKDNLPNINEVLMLQLLIISWLSGTFPKMKLKFLQRFGYLDKQDPNSEALYKEEAIVEAIKNVQLFGDIAQTGIMDNYTRDLMTKPRCGVPDISPRLNHTSRSKRYVIASEGWSKRHLTYFLANWTPKLGNRDVILKQLEQAFHVWSEYSPLTFTRSENPDADIVVGFAHWDHADGYPFDGPGLTLAHAYFPYDFAALGGDIHFDNDEDWVLGRTNGVEFFTVAAHEIGHSLGLAHSPVRSSIMFPYYKGYDPHFRLDYDDILAMYQLYVLKVFEDGHVDQQPTDDANDRDEEETGKDEKDVDTNDDDVDEDSQQDDKDKGNEDDSDGSVDPGIWPEVPTGDDPVVHDDIPLTTTTTTLAPPTSTSNPIPDICEGSYDALAAIRGELFVFKGQFMWRFKDRNQPIHGYPVQFKEMFRFPTQVDKIDAVFENPNDGHIYFFAGTRIWTFNGDSFLDVWPKRLLDLGMPHSARNLDAAFIWGKNGKVYLFKDNHYWRYDVIEQMMDKGYPRGINKWRRVPHEIDTAFKWKDGNTYFFKGKDFYRFNDKKVRVDDGYPQLAPQFWFGCRYEEL